VLQVDETGHIAGRRQTGGLEEAGLVQPERGHPVQAPGVVHQRGAVVSHRPHDGRPADPQVAGHRGDRMAVLAHPPTGLNPGPLGQHRPGADRGHLLSPGADPTGRLPTAPDPLAPGQHHRPATDRQVPHPNRSPAVGFGPDPTALTADHGGRGLHLEPPLTAYHPRGEDLEAVQAQQPGGRGTTVLTHLGPPLAGRHTSASYARSQVPLGSLRRRQQDTTPRFLTKSHIRQPSSTSNCAKPLPAATSSLLPRRRLRSGCVVAATQSRGDHGPSPGRWTPGLCGRG
jgi:hypothetical protein